MLNNSLILDINRNTLSKDLNKKFTIDNDYYIYINEFIKWIKSQGKSKNKFSLKQLRKKFKKTSILNNTDKGIVYIVVYHDCIIYTGSTKDSLFERYLSKFNMTKMMQQFNSYIDSNDLEFYIYKRKDFKELESKFINYFCAKGIVTCNVRSENPKGLFKLLSEIN